MNRTEAGSLGLQSQVVNRTHAKIKLHDKLFAEYEKNPKFCSNCGKKIEYKYRVNTFCSKICSGRGRPSPLITTGTFKHKKCLICGEDTTNPKYCSKACSCKAHKAQTAIAIESGTYCNSNSTRTVRTYLIETRGYRCEECSRKIWRGKPIPLNVHHIDGNATNNIPTNIKLLCLNCHGLTENYGSKNIGNSTRSYRYNKLITTKFSKKQKFCKDCGRNISIRAIRCASCNNKIKPRKVKNRPSIQILQQNVDSIGFSGTSRKYGVTLATIQKWMGLR